MSEDVTQALLSLALLVASGLFGVLIKYLTVKYGTEKLQQYRDKAEVIVDAAEQMGAAFGWDGAKKKQYAIDLMVKLGLSLDDAEAFIEAAVAELIKYGTQLTADPCKPGSVIRAPKEPPC
jgi:hypothetical protein